MTARRPLATRTALAALVCSSALLVTGCASDGGSTGASTRSPSTSSSPIAPRRRPDAAAPLAVILSGDSVMLDNLVHGFNWALINGHEAIPTGVWMLSMTRDAASHVLLRRVIRQQDPDLVIVSMGVWELDAVEDHMHDPGWRDRYVADTLDPFIDELTARGAEVLWIGLPTWNAQEPQVGDLQALQDIYRSFAQHDDRVSFLDSGRYVDDRPGHFTPTLPGSDGTSLTVRNPDGLHLCPDGVVRVVTPALAWIQRAWRIRVAQGWQTAPWDLGPDGRVRESFQNCPTLAGADPTTPTTTRAR